MQKDHFRLMCVAQKRRRLSSLLVSQTNEMAAMLVSQTSPVGVELFSYFKASFCRNKNLISC